jgi:hypothetical protein
MKETTMKYHLLIIAIIFAAIAFALNVSAQTCQDGCFFSNTYQGQNALLNFTSGGNDTAFGSEALTNNTTGEDNTALGTYALLVNTTGIDNTAVGYNALYNNNGNGNTAVGSTALLSNTTGSYNTAVGQLASYLNTTGTDNAVLGQFALYSNTTGSSNTAVGEAAMYYNNGSNNTAVGYSAINKNTTGSENAALGDVALYSNTTGSNNTAVGEGAMYSNNGSNNTAVGYTAFSDNTTGGTNTALGSHALLANTTGNNNIAIGFQAGLFLTTGNNNIDIGNSGVAAEANTIRIGKSGTQRKTFVAGISGTTVAGGVGVIVGSNGQLGTIVSSARFKEAIKPMDKASESILALKPVTFRYKKELDPEGIPQFGLVAEDVEKVNRDLVARDEQGKPYTVRYEAVNAMLLNEFLKEHKAFLEERRKVEGLVATVAQQRKDFEAAVTQLKTQVQKVSDEVELNKRARQIVVNNQ